MKRRTFLSLATTTAALARPRYGGALRLFPQPLIEGLDARVAGVCESIQPDSSRKAWTLSLKPGIVRHDKSPLTPEALSQLLKTRAPDLTVAVASRTSLTVSAARPNTDVLALLEDRVAVDCGPFIVRKPDPSVPGGNAWAEAFEDHWGGRPFIDRIEEARSAAGADVAELAPAGVRQFRSAEHRIWPTLPNQLLAIEAAGLGPDVRGALSLAIDREAIVRFLLQGYGEVAGGLLPQWLSGYAFLFSTQRDLQRARALARGGPISLGHEPADRLIAERIALNGRDAGLDIHPYPSRRTGAALVRLPLPRGLNSYEAEKAALEERGLVPVAHVPRIFAIHNRVRGWDESNDRRNPRPRFEELWLAAV